MTKTQITSWIKIQIRAIHDGFNVNVPCLEGLEATLQLLEDNVCMPREPTVEMARACSDPGTVFAGKERYKRLRAVLTEPQVKTVWCFSCTSSSSNVHYLVKYDTKEMAETNRDVFISGRQYTNVSPIWSQEVQA